MLRRIFQTPVIVKRSESLLLRLTASPSTLSAAQQSNRIPSDEDDDLNKPIKFSNTEAAKWSSRKARSYAVPPWYQDYVISLSVGIFLIYFCVLREESDIDHKFDRKLSDHIKGMEP